MRSFLRPAYVGYIATSTSSASPSSPAVRIFAKRFTVQERIGQRIADALQTMLEPHGVAVYLEGITCVRRCAGAESSPLTRTTFWRATTTAIRAAFRVLRGV